MAPLKRVVSIASHPTQIHYGQILKFNIEFSLQKQEEHTLMNFFFLKKAINLHENLNQDGL